MILQVLEYVEEHAGAQCSPNMFSNFKTMVEVEETLLHSLSEVHL